MRASGMGAGPGGGGRARHLQRSPHRSSPVPCRPIPCWPIPCWPVPCWPVPSCGMAAGCPGHVSAHRGVLRSAEPWVGRGARLSASQRAARTCGSTHRGRRSWRASRTSACTAHRCRNFRGWWRSCAVSRFGAADAASGRARSCSRSTAHRSGCGSCSRCGSGHRSSRRNCPLDWPSWQSAPWSRFRGTNKQLTKCSRGSPSLATRRPEPASGTAAPRAEFNLNQRTNTSTEVR